MSWEVARRSIDMFVAHPSDTDPVFVTFFGGEPLTAWDLVLICTRYLRGMELPNLGIVMNTNLTLLNETRAALLVEHDVGLVVSLDGPATIHDAARRLASGRPTHSRVTRWLDFLRERYPSHWRERVVLQATFDRHSDLETVFEYFCDEAWRDLPNSISGEVRLRAARRRCNEQREKVLSSLIRFVRFHNSEPRESWDHPFSLHHLVSEAKRR